MKKDSITVFFKYFIDFLFLKVLNTNLLLIFKCPYDYQKKKRKWRDELLKYYKIQNNQKIKNSFNQSKKK